MQSDRGLRMLGERLNLTNRLIITMALACVVFGVSVSYLYFKSQIAPTGLNGEPTDGNLIGVIHIEGSITSSDGAGGVTEAINEAISADTRDETGEPIEPTHLATAGAWCDDCDFAQACPEYTLQAAGLVVAPQEIVDLVMRRAELEAAHREYGRVNDQLKRHWKNAGEGQYYCGDYTVTVKRTKDREVAAQPATIRKGYLRSTYRRQNGGGDDD